MLLRVRAAVLLVAIGLAPTAARGGAVPISRESSLTAAGQITGDQFDLSDSFTTLGHYDNIISDTLTPTGGGTTRAEASQRSLFPTPEFEADESNIFAHAAGHASAQVAELDAIAASASNNFLGVFDVTDQPLTMRVIGEISSTFDSEASVALTNDDASQTFFSRLIDVGTQEELPFDENVVLQPGRYRFTAAASANGTPTFNLAEFTVDLRLAGDGGTVIPLPAGIWPGAVALIASALWARRSS